MHNAAIMIHKFEILSRESTDSDGIMIHNIRQLMKNAQKRMRPKSAHQAELQYKC